MYQLAQTPGTNGKGGGGNSQQQYCQQYTALNSISTTIALQLISKVTKEVTPLVRILLEAFQEGEYFLTCICKGKCSPFFPTPTQVILFFPQLQIKQNISNHVQRHEQVQRCSRYTTLFSEKRMETEIGGGTPTSTVQSSSIRTTEQAGCVRDIGDLPSNLISVRHDHPESLPGDRVCRDDRHHHSLGYLGHHDFQIPVLDFQLQMDYLQVDHFIAPMLLVLSDYCRWCAYCVSQLLHRL